MLTLEDLFTLENLNWAFEDVTKRSKWKYKVQQYRANILSNNIKLQKELLNKTYTISKTNDFVLNERGKLRYIKSPAIRDRIVQKILCKYILIPMLSDYLIYDNYASLKSRGTSLARKRILIFLKEYIKENNSDGYILQLDIKKIF